MVHYREYHGELNVLLLDLLFTIQETVETAENRMKLFLLHTVMLNKLPLKYRAQSVNSTLLDEFSKTQDGKVYPFHEVSVRYDSITNF